MRGAVVLLLASCGRIGYEAQRDGDLRDAAADTVVPPACGATVLLQDSFDDGVPDPRFGIKADSGITVVETGGDVEIDFATSVPAAHWGYYRSVASYPAANTCVIVEVAGTPDVLNGDAAAYVKLRTADHEVEFYQHGGMLDLRTRVGNSLAVVANLPWDAVSDRFLRLRNQAGVMYWDTSPDGATFLQRLAMPEFLEPTWQLEFGAGAGPATVANGGRGTFATAQITGS